MFDIVMFNSDQFTNATEAKASGAIHETSIGFDEGVGTPVRDAMAAMETALNCVGYDSSVLQFGVEDKEGRFIEIDYFLEKMEGVFNE